MELGEEQGEELGEEQGEELRLRMGRATLAD